MNKIDLSIITITYKDPHGLERTLESIKRELEKQQNREFTYENIIIDSSSDESAQVIEKFRPILPIRHHVTPPHGIYSAMNDGLTEARGRYVCFLNSGDTLYDGALLLKMVSELKTQPKISLAAAGARLTREGQYRYAVTPKTTFRENVLGHNHLCHQAILYDRAQIRPYDTRFRLAADYELNLWLYEKNAQALFYAEPLVEFDQSGSSSQFSKVLNEFHAIHVAHAQHQSWHDRLAHRRELAIETAKIHGLKTLKQMVEKTRLQKYFERIWIWLHQ